MVVVWQPTWTLNSPSVMKNNNFYPPNPSQLCTNLVIFITISDSSQLPCPHLLLFPWSGPVSTEAASVLISSLPPAHLTQASLLPGSDCKLVGWLPALASIIEPTRHWAECSRWTSQAPPTTQNIMPHMLRFWVVLASLVGLWFGMHKIIMHHYEYDSLFYSFL